MSEPPLIVSFDTVTVPVQVFGVQRSFPRAQVDGAREVVHREAWLMVRDIEGHLRWSWLERGRLPVEWDGRWETKPRKTWRHRLPVPAKYARVRTFFVLAASVRLAQHPVTGEWLVPPPGAPDLRVAVMRPPTL